MDSIFKRYLAISLLTTFSVFFPAQAFALSNPLIEESPRPANATSMPSVKRDRFVKIHEEQFESLHPRNFKPGVRPSLRVNLFDDADYNLIATHSAIRNGGRIVVTGHLEGVPGSLAVLSHSTGVVTGILFIPGKGTFKILPSSNGLHRVLEMDEENGFSCAMDSKLPSTSDPQVQASLPQEGMPYLIPPNYPGGCNYAQNPTVVDLMVVYTPSALAFIGSTQAMESLIDTVVFYNNMVYFNSGVNVQLRLVYSGQIGYAESGSFYTDLTRMGNGSIPAIQTLRNTYGADLAAMWVANPDPVMGLANMPGNYSCEHISFAESMIHEIGHNFGCGHDFANGGPGLYSYSAGNRYTVNGVQYRTIMAYAPGVYTPYFSSPLVTYLGSPTGVANLTDNVRTINQTASIIASSEPTLATLPTISVTGPTDGSVFTGPLNLNLTVNASSGGSIVQVDFYVDSQYLGSTTTSPYSLNWPLVPSGSHFITAHAVDNQGAMQFSCPVSIYVNPTLPNPWIEQDIGWLMQTTVTFQELKYMGLLGSGSYSGGVFTVNGAGSGLSLNLAGKEEDSFQFVNQPFCNVSTLTARLASLTGGGAKNEAGLMIRDNSTPLSPYAFVGVAKNGTAVFFGWRSTEGGNTLVTLGTPLAMPVWFQLQRNGTTFTGYESTDGVSWTKVGSATISMGANAAGGFAVSSANDVSLATAVFDNVTVTLPCVPPTNTFTPAPTFTPTPTPTPSPTPSPTPTNTPSCVGIITTYAGTGVAGFAGDGGPATSAELDQNEGIAVDAAGNLYIADSQGVRIRKVSSSGIITTYAGNGSCCYSGDGGPANAASIGVIAPSTDCAGNLYLDNAYYNTGTGTNYAYVRKINTCGTISTIAGTGLSGYSGDGGPATLAAVNFPYQTAVDSLGNIYFADSTSAVVRKINPAGTISTVLTPPLSNPGGVVLDGLGNLYVSDAGTGNVLKITPSGSAVTLANLPCPDQLAMDCNSNLYISDYCSRKITKIDSVGIITTVAGTGAAGYMGDGGPATSATFGEIRGVAVDQAGNLYVSDVTYNVVRKITSCVAEGPCPLCAITPVCPLIIPTATPTPTMTPSSTPTASPTNTPTSTVTETPTPPNPPPTATSTQPVDVPIPTVTETFTPTNSCTSTPTSTPTLSPTMTPSSTASNTGTPTYTLTPTCVINIWPNPYRPSKAINGTLKISCLPLNAKVSIYTLSGEWVNSVSEAGGMASWNGQNSRLVSVSSGIYYYVVLTVDGQILEKGKFLIVDN